MSLLYRIVVIIPYIVDIIPYIVDILSTFLPPSRRLLYFLVPIGLPRTTLKKHRLFKPVSMAEKLRKPAPKASKKHQNSTPELPINDVCENMVFAIPSMRKPCFESANCQQFHHKIIAKSDLERSSKQIQNFTHQTSKICQNGLPKSSKIT